MGVAAVIQFVYFAIRPLARAWRSGVIRNLNDGPRPRDDPRSHASGVDAQRILLFGTGAAVGWGVASNDLALPGALARALSALTGRGADVDAVAVPELLAADAIRRFRSVDLDRYDAIVLTLGLGESLRLSSVAAWRRDLDALLAYLGAVAPQGTQIFVLGIHSPTRIGGYDRVVAPLFARHRAALNRASAEVCAVRPDTNFISLESVQRFGVDHARSSALYRRAGLVMAAQMAPALGRPSVRGTERVGRARTSAGEPSRWRALDDLHLFDTPPEERFDRLADFARRMFSTPNSTITLFDQERFWTKSSVGAPRSEGPRDESICFTTIDGEDALVISDASKDSRFARLAPVTGPPGVRFYAGHRIEAPGGVPIGALCVYDSVPHDIAGFDRALLRDLALLVQREIWLGSRAGVAV